MLGQDYDDDNEQDYIAGIKKEYNKAQGKIKKLGVSNKNSPFAKDLKGDLVKDDEKRKAKKYKAEQASDKLKDDKLKSDTSLKQQEEQNKIAADKLKDDETNDALKMKKELADVDKEVKENAEDDETKKDMQQYAIKKKHQMQKEKEKANKEA